MIGSFVDIGAAAASSPAPLVPGNLAELAVWLDGFDVNNGGPQPSDLDIVSDWANKGNSGADFLNASNQPTFHDAYLNGFPAVVFPAGKYLKTLVNPHAADSARHIWAVVKIPAGIIGQFYGPNDLIGYTLEVGNEASSNVYTDGTVNTAATAAPLPVEIAILEYLFDGDPSHLPILKVNGVIFPLHNSSGSGVGNEVFTNTLYLGAGPTGYFTEGIGEILSYTAVQDAGVKANNQAYLANKWGVPV